MSLRSIGRSLDPTSRKAPLGGLARAVISQVPGGAAVMGVVDTANAAKSAGKPAAKPAAPAAPPVPGAKPETTGAKVLAFVKRPVVLIGAAVVVVGAVVWFMFRK